MKLSTESGGDLDEPSPDPLTRALATLGLPGHGSAVLGEADPRHIQAAGTRSSGFVVEYREGSERHHHFATTSDISHQEVLNLFLAYRRGDPAWRTMLEWQRGFAPADPSARVASPRAPGVRLGLFLVIGILGSRVVRLCLRRRVCRHCKCRLVRAPGSNTRKPRKLSDSGAEDMSVVITNERPDSAAATELIAELEAQLFPLYPPESRHGYSVEKLVREGVAFFVIRHDGLAAGCGGLQLFGADYGELRRMYVRPAFRGLGLAKSMLEHLAAHARSRGVGRLRLETGVYQHEAIGLYERMGFERIAAFGEYRDDPVSLFYEKALG